jgi:hypothetical protein
MLKRAGELFAILAGGSLQALRFEFDEGDNVELAGIRQDGNGSHRRRKEWRDCAGD